MGSVHFPSGRWAGFYVYASNDTRHPMSLHMRFSAGALDAEGNDEIGPFACAGWYSEASGDCGWQKKYLGKHSVDYNGARDGKGIWGTWKLNGFSGGFHIWPEVDEQETLPARVESEPSETHRLSPAVGVSQSH